MEQGWWRNSHHIKELNAYQSKLNSDRLAKMDREIAIVGWAMGFCGFGACVAILAIAFRIGIWLGS